MKSHYDHEELSKKEHRWLIIQLKQWIETIMLLGEAFLCDFCVLLFLSHASLERREKVCQKGDRLALAAFVEKDGQPKAASVLGVGYLQDDAEDDQVNIQ